MRKKRFAVPGRKPKRPSFVLYGLAVLLFAAGIYLLILVLSPKTYMQPEQAWNVPVATSPQELTESRLYIPRLHLNLTYKAGDARVLSNNVWHRFPERGDPEKGGNFILAGHRFELGLTPGETKRKSPFYNIQKIQTGDHIYADYDGKRYKYKITKSYSVKPTQVEIENPSATPKMTLYTCTIRGETDGREVLEATLVQKDVDPRLEMDI